MPKRVSYRILRRSLYVCHEFSSSLSPDSCRELRSIRDEYMTKTAKSRESTYTRGSEVHVGTSVRFV